MRMRVVSILASYLNDIEFEIFSESDRHYTSYISFEIFLTIHITNLEICDHLRNFGTISTK